MDLVNVIIHDQSERQNRTDGFFTRGEPSPIESNNLLRAIENNIQARRENMSNMVMWQRIGDQDAKLGKTQEAARDLENFRYYAALVQQIEAELAELFAKAGAAFGNNKALNASV